MTLQTGGHGISDKPGISGKVVKARSFQSETMPERTESQRERAITAHTSRSHCPVERYLSVFRDHWSLLIMRDLLEGPKRFSELKKSLIGITAKTLTERLVELKDAGIITRVAYPDIPIKVLYSLTEKGLDFDNVLEATRSWGEKWIPLAQ